jgi:capsular exopolysaccharide synthesis family protein
MKAGQYYQSQSLPDIQFEEMGEGGLNLRQLFTTLRQRALVILGVTIAVTSAAAFKALTDTPTYSGVFEILVQPTSPESQVLSSVPETLTGRENQTQPTQQVVVDADLLKILRSPRVLRPVYSKLKLQYPDFCIQILPSGPNPTELPAELVDNFCYGAFTNNLSVDALNQNSNIIQVSYQSLNPDLVEGVLQEIAKAYLDYSLASRQADIRRAIDFVETKLPDLEENVDTLQEELQQLRLQNDLIDPESRGGEISSQLNTFKQQQRETEVELEQIRQVYSDLQAQLAQPTNETAGSSALSNNPRYQAILGQILTLDGEIADATTLYFENTPEMQTLREERQNLLGLLAREGEQAQREVLSRIQEIEARNRALQDTIASLNAGVRDLSGLSRRYTEIQRDLEIATENLNQFLSKREALQIDAAQREVPWELLTPPSAPSPSAASLSRNLVLGAVLGLLLGIGAAVGLDRLTDIVQTPEEIKRISGLPLLGVIPLNDELSESETVVKLMMLQREVSTLTVATKDRAAGSEISTYRADPFFEAFRSVYANVRLLSSDAPVRSLIISSAIPAEGKSTIAACLALAAAALGQRVLLVDTDLRRPRLHEYLDLPSSKGLTDIMIGDLNPKDAIQRSLIEPTLFILPAGNIAPDPARLLSSQKMQQLMEKVQAGFDLIIYDTPPLLGFADAYLLAPHTDGMILVAGMGRVKRSQLEQAFEQIKVAGIQPLGVIARSNRRA